MVIAQRLFIAGLSFFAATQSAFAEEKVPFAYCDYYDHVDGLQRIYLGEENHGFTKYVSPQDSLKFSPDITKPIMVNGGKNQLAFFFNDYRLTIRLGTKNGQSNPPLASQEGPFWNDLIKAKSADRNTALAQGALALAKKKFTFVYQFPDKKVFEVRCGLVPGYFVLP